MQGNQGFLTDAFLFNNLGAGTYEKPWVGSSLLKVKWPLSSVV